MRAKYGEEYGLTIMQDKDCETVSTITVPYVEEWIAASLKKRSEEETQFGNMARFNK